MDKKYYKSAEYKLIPEAMKSLQTLRLEKPIMMRKVMCRIISTTFFIHFYLCICEIQCIEKKLCEFVQKCYKTKAIVFNVLHSFHISALIFS